MAIVSFKIGPRFYKFSCTDGQESHMRALAETLDKKADQLTKSLGFMQEGQLLAMLCLLVAEELNQLRQTTASGVESIDEQMIQSLNTIASKVSSLADSLQ